MRSRRPRAALEALAMVDAVKPHVVLLDVTMPEMDGMETLKRLAASTPGCPSSW